MSRSNDSTNNPPSVTNESQEELVTPRQNQSVTERIVARNGLGAPVRNRGQPVETSYMGQELNFAPANESTFDESSDIDVTDDSKSLNDTEDDSDRCYICLGKVRRRAHIDSCRHEYCFKCIRTWSNDKDTCPTCRMTFTTIKYEIIGGQRVYPVKSRVEELSFALQLINWSSSSNSALQMIQEDPLEISHTEQLPYSSASSSFVNWNETPARRYSSTPYGGQSVRPSWADVISPHGLVTPYRTRDLSAANLNDSLDQGKAIDEGTPKASERGLDYCSVQSPTSDKENSN